MNLRYFKLTEFDSPDLVGSGQRMEPTFLEKLDIAREKAGIPFKIRSGYRTSKHNAAVHGKSDSSHTIGRACDIEAIGDRNRYLIITSLLAVGFNRIGIGQTFIHVDDDPVKDKQVVWLYV